MFHIIALVPAFLESDTVVDPGFVQTKLFFFICYQLFPSISVIPKAKQLYLSAQWGQVSYLCVSSTQNPPSPIKLK